MPRILLIIEFRLIKQKYHYFSKLKARHEFMTMADWAKHLDNVLTMNGEKQSYKHNKSGLKTAFVYGLPELLRMRGRRGRTRDCL